MKVRPPRTGELVAREIRQRILTGELVHGDEIPPEAGLLAEFGVSRPTVRDALLILEAEGLIEVRRGRFGGATVLGPTADRAAYHLGLVLQRERATMEDIAGARAVLEPVCASLCASRPKHKRIARELAKLNAKCEAAVDGGEDPPDFSYAALAFHRGILDRCGNTTLRLLIATLESVWVGQEQRLLNRIHEVAGYPPRAEKLSIIERQSAVVSDIAAGDAEGAERSMREHARRSMAYWATNAVALERSEQPAANRLR